MALSTDTRSEINDWIKWFNYHSDKVAQYPMEQKMVWMLKAINGAYLMMTKLAEDQNNTGKIDYPGFSRANGLLIPKTLWGDRAPRR